MKFVEFNLAKPAFDVRECQQRGLTFAAAAARQGATDHLWTAKRRRPRRSRK